MYYIYASVVFRQKRECSIHSRRAVIYIFCFQNLTIKSLHCVSC